MSKQIIRDGLRVLGTDYLEIPYGNVAQRGTPSTSGVKAAIRVNRNSGRLEWYSQTRGVWTQSYELPAGLDSVPLTNITGNSTVSSGKNYQISNPSGGDVTLSINAGDWNTGDYAIFSTGDGDFISNYVHIVKQPLTVDFILNTATSNNVYKPNSPNGKRIRLASNNTVYVFRCVSSNNFTLETINTDTVLSRGRVTASVTDGMELIPNLINYLAYDSSANQPPASIKLPDSTLGELENGTEVVLAIRSNAVEPLMTGQCKIDIQTQGSDRIGARDKKFYVPPNVDHLVFTLQGGAWYHNAGAPTQFEVSQHNVYSLNCRDYDWVHLHNSKLMVNKLELPAEHSFGIGWIHGEHTNPLELTDTMLEVTKVGGSHYRSDIGLVDPSPGEASAISMSIPKYNAELELHNTSSTALTWRSRKPLYRRFKTNTDFGFLEVMPSPKTTFVHGTNDDITLALVKDKDTHAWLNGDELHIINHLGAAITIDVQGTSPVSGLNVKDENLAQDIAPIVMAQKGLLVLMFIDNEFIVKYRGYYGI